MERKGPLYGKKIIQTLVICLICAAVVFGSIKCILPRTTGEEVHASEMEYLDYKKGQVLKMTAAATVASAAISVLPDDTATPIANQIAELTDYFLIILSVLYMEKFLISVIGYASFQWIIPIAAGLAAVYYLIRVWKNDRKETLKHIAIKVTCFALVIYFIIPLSVGLSSLIEERNSTTIQETLDATTQMLAEEKEAEDEKGGILGWVKGIGEDVVSGYTYAKELLNHFIDAIAIMIVTACILPILVVVGLVALLKIIFGIDIQPTIVDISNKRKKNIRQMNERRRMRRQQGFRRDDFRLPDGTEDR